jgi:tetratricopeptide (TPR) repeat protein
LPWAWTAGYGEANFPCDPVARRSQRRLNNPTKLGIGLEWLGIVYERQGQLPAALEKYRQALELARKYMSPQEQAVLEQHIARVRGMLGQ